LNLLGLTPEQERHVRGVRQIVKDVDAAIELLGKTVSPPRAPQDIELPQAALIAGRCRRELEGLAEQRQGLEEERALILKFRPFFAAFQKIGESGLDLDGIRVFYLVLKEDGEDELRRMRAAFRQALGDGFELLSQPSDSGDSAMLLAVPSADAMKAEQLLSEAGVQALSLPDQFEEQSVGATIQRMQARLGELPGELATIERERRRIAEDRGRDLARIQATVRDHLATIEATEKAVVTPRAFVLEGWIPSAARPELDRQLGKSFGNQIEVEAVSSEEWAGDTVPVVLHNPRLFRPFEAITGMMPLPKYGTVDPTPFVAVFFPMFFGIVLGDIGYGTILGIVSLILRIRSRPDTTLRSVSEIGLACSLFAIIFGFLYGELFGDLGHRIGLHPIIFNREEAFFPFLGFAVALGIVHIVLGLLVGAVKMFRGDKRRAIGKGMAALMVVLIALALMAAFGMLPGHHCACRTSDFDHRRRGARTDRIGLHAWQRAFVRTHHGRRHGIRHDGCRRESYGRRIWRDLGRRPLRPGLSSDQLRPGRIQPDDSHAATSLRGVLWKVLQPGRFAVPALSTLVRARKRV
jgi:V/A-type H+-transporting ATPase subunit I